MNTLLIEPLPLQIKDDQIIRSCHVVRLDNDNEIDRQTLWFQFPNIIQPSDEQDCDSYLLCILMDALTEARAIIVKGSVSSSLLSNLIEYQRAWNMWRPNNYSIVDITVEYVRKDIGRVDGAVCAFSGGADSMFSVWQHTKNKNSYRTQKINFCSLIHGFDIPLADTEAFTTVLESSREILADINLSVLPIKTNYRNITRADWGFSHGSALVGVLVNFKQNAGTCLVGSSYPYAYLNIPWGSSPITDHLLGSEEFPVMHDGASYTRTEKVNAFALWKVGVNNLRVCWEGKIKDKNCGRCEKCVRTQFNFLACGYPIPSCFPADSNPYAELKKIIPKHQGIRSEWQQIHDYAALHNIGDSWRPYTIKIVNRGLPRFLSFLNRVI